MKNTENKNRPQIERSYLSDETIDVISQILSLEAQPVNTDMKSDLVQLAIYLKNEDSPGSRFDYYVHWINNFTNELLKGLSEEPPKEKLQDCITDTAVKMIQDLFQLDFLYVKSEIFDLYQRIDLHTRQLKETERDGPLMLISWLNDLFDSVYKDIKKAKMA
jgi:hypothetical protein